MKKFILALIAAFITLGASAQISNSKWKATLPLNDPLDVVFNFENDTLFVTSAADNSNIETLKYTLSDTTLTVQKLYGQSGCDTATIGSYSCIVSGNEMKLKLISDACYDRMNAIQDITLYKEE